MKRLMEIEPKAATSFDPGAMAKAINQMARAMHLWRLGVMESRGWGLTEEQLRDWRARSTGVSQARRYLARKKRRERNDSATIVLGAALFIWTLYLWGGSPV